MLTTVNWTVEEHADHESSDPTGINDPIMKELQSKIVIRNGTHLSTPDEAILLFSDAAELNGNLLPRDSGSKSYQNQMLPIYCSIMGLIIVFLLFYVVYKLWKQREAAVVSGKLGSGGFPCVGCNGTPSSKCHIAIPRHNLLTKEAETPSPRSDQFAARGTDVYINSHEWDPLLHNSAGESYKEKPLKSLQPHTLGYFAQQLARQDWKRLAAVLKPVQSQSLNNTTSAMYKEILQAATESRSTHDTARISVDNAETGSSCAKEDENLSGAVRFVSDLCADSSILTVNSLIEALRMTGLADLIPQLLIAEVPDTHGYSAIPSV